MSLDYARERPQFVFGLQELSTDRPPYDVINLIDGRNENGTNISGKGTDQGIENLCKRIGAGIALNAGSVGKSQDDVLANLAKTIGSQDKKRWDNKYPHYSSFGLSTLVYPMEKHFNRAYSIYCFLLIDDTQKISKGEALNIEPQEIEKDLRDFSTEAKLWDEDNHVIDDLISPGSIDTTIPMPEDSASADELEALANAEEDRVVEAIKASLGINLPRKKRGASVLLRDALVEREKNKGPGYSLRFAERLGGQMDSFRGNRLAEVQQMEGELIGMKSQADRLLHELKESGLWDRVRGKRKGISQSYLAQRSLILNTRIEIERRRAGWEVFDELKAETAQYKEGMNLSEVEKKFSQIREQLFQQLFTTTHLPEQFGEFAVMIEPLRIVVRGRGKEGLKTKVAATRKSWDNFSDFLKEMGIGVNFNEFLKECGLDYGKLTDIPLEDLKEKLLAYSQRQMVFVKEMTLEDVILFDIEDDKGQEERLKEQLQEASLQATPLWYHKAMAERAAMMEELFILGVGNEEKSRLKTSDYGVRLLPYLSTQNTKYPPNFTSTLDPYKLFFFKYKAPLPAFLLQDMNGYRKEYHKIPVYMTPHIEKDMELKSEDLFPHTAVEERQLRAFALAASPPFGLIRERLEERGRERLQVYYLEDARLVRGREEVLGQSRLNAFEAFGEDQKKTLRERVIAALKEDYQKDPDRIKQQLLDYIKELEDRFAEEREQLRVSPQDSSLTIGEELLLRDEIGVIKNFLQFKGGMEDFLEKIR